MGKNYEEITPELSEWISRQRMFFVSTAPLAGEGLINCSPKGLDTFRILGPRSVGYLDLTGSGIETVAHLRENGRIVVMFCAFDGAPNILRLHGRGKVLMPDDDGFGALSAKFPKLPGTRSIIQIDAAKISDSCGFAVPRYDFVDERDQLTKWAATKGEPAMVEYRAKKNALSLDGLRGF